MRIARYLSKYLGKTLDEADLDGRHRYRASRIRLETNRALVLQAGSLNEALDRLLSRLDLSRGDVQVFFFSDYSGFWFSCSGDIGDSPPPF